MSTASFSFLNEAAIDHCPDFPLCPNVSAVPDLPQLTRPCAEGTRDGQVCYFGGLPWVAHGIWLVYRHMLDVSILQELMPLLKRATALYTRHAVHNATDGKLHLPATFSPEYAILTDCSFDLALFRWCLRTCIHVGSNLLPGSATAAELITWQDTLQILASPQVDPKKGSLMIGDGIPLHSGLKMWSHIFSVFPLGLLDWTVAHDREVWTKSLELFSYFNNPARCASPACIDGGSATGTIQSREGFAYLAMGLLTILAKPSLPGGAPEEWVDYGLGNVTERFFAPLHVPQLGAGTFYADHAACGAVPGCRQGMSGPCNESPIMASLVLQQMLLQSWNSKSIAIFPSVPSSWADARFARLRAEGAVLVSAVRANHTTQWFSLNATRGGAVSVHSSIIDLVSTVAGITPVASPSSAIGSGMFDIAGGAAPWTAVFYSKAQETPPSMEELALAMTPLPAMVTNLWGSRSASPPPPPGPTSPPPPPPPPPPGPLPPLPPCPIVGCQGCQPPCHWPYLNSTLPDPKGPVMGLLLNASTLACETNCGTTAGCVGFTRKNTERSCYFYDLQQVSGIFSHGRSDVSWHPKPKLQ
jgi:hypothetical protein